MPGFRLEDLTDGQRERDKVGIGRGICLACGVELYNREQSEVANNRTRGRRSYTTIKHKRVRVEGLMNALVLYN